MDHGGLIVGKTGIKRGSINGIYRRQCKRVQHQAGVPYPSNLVPFALPFLHSGDTEMNYYPFHIGDYVAHTAHLDPIEDIAYRRMLDLYYQSENALPSSEEVVARLIRMKDSVPVISAVLQEFFVSGVDGWTHNRCDIEITKMRDKQTKARASAGASVKARRANAQRTLNERLTNVELPTPTPTPEENTPLPHLPETREYPDWLNRKLWGDFRAWRSEKGRPLSIIEESTAIEQLRSFRESGQDIDAVIRQSIVQNWPGLFPVKGGEKVKKIGTPKTVTAANGVAYDF